MLVSIRFISCTSLLVHSYELKIVGNVMALCNMRSSLCGLFGNSGLTSTTQEYSNPFNDE